MRAEIQTVVDYQVKIGLDVLVHGEAERNDMVEYFGEQLSGFAFTEQGWVEWASYAQSLTDKVMTGMHTGPITILQWSFVRDDQPRAATSTQIALAIRDEVIDLEKAGIKIIQIDEAALREGLSLRRADWQAYMDNAVSDFRIASSAVTDATQIQASLSLSPHSRSKA